MSENTSKQKSGGSELAGKYLTFALGSEEYGLAILKVREIVGYQAITTVPKTPKEIKGVINLRGQVIPIIDLRSRFGMSEQAVTEQTCIIVVESHHDGRMIPTGVIVDNVSEVLDISAEQIEPPPEFGARAKIDFIQGIGKIGSTVKILLDIDRVLTGCEASVRTELASEGAVASI